MQKSILLMLGLLLGIYSTAQNTDTLSGYNGTYNSPTNLFRNNNYIRVHFLNDSIFVFTIIEAYNPSENGQINTETKDLRLSGHSFFGIARLVNYKGVKCWIGVSDFSAGYMEPDNPSYLNLKGRVDFDIILKNIDNPHGFVYDNSSLEYNVYQFFFEKNKIIMKGLRGVTRFFEIGDYTKIDNSKMLFGILPDDNFFKKTHSHAAPTIVKTPCTLIPIPIREKLPDNKSIGTLRQGDKVYLPGYDFMKYTFILQFDKDYNVTKYGWLSREFLQKAKQ